MVITHDKTNRSGEVTHGLNPEDATLTEGSNRYDIRFYATAPGEDGLIGLIINPEAQNRFNPGYPLLKRSFDSDGSDRQLGVLFIDQKVWYNGYTNRQRKRTGCR